MTQKIVTNLRLRSDCLHVTQKTLALFGDLAAGFCTGKLMLKLDVVHSVLQGHTDFPFLRVPANARVTERRFTPRSQSYSSPRTPRSASSHS